MAHSVCAWHCSSDTSEEGGFLDEKKNGEKKTGQELQNETQESKRQRGEDWKWKEEPSLADSHWIAQQVGGAHQLHLAKREEKHRIWLRSCVHTWTVFPCGLWRGQPHTPISAVPVCVKLWRKAIYSFKCWNSSWNVESFIKKNYLIYPGHGWSSSALYM